MKHNQVLVFTISISYIIQLSNTIIIIIFKIGKIKLYKKNLSTVPPVLSYVWPFIPTRLGRWCIWNYHTQIKAGCIKRILDLMGPNFHAKSQENPLSYF